MSKNKANRPFPKEIREYYKDAYKLSIENGSINHGVSLLDFVKQERDKVVKIVESTPDINKEKIDWLSVAKKLRESWKIDKFFPLSTLQKIVQFAVDDEIDIKDVFNFPENKVLQNPQILETAIPETKYLITSQSDNDYWFLVEWVSNAIDAANPWKQIWRFWEGFFQSLSKIWGDDKNIEITSKQNNQQGYRVTLKSTDTDIFIATKNQSIDTSGTKVSLNKKYSKKEKSKIKRIIKEKFRTNTRAIIEYNWERINNFDEYNYLNWEKFRHQELPTIQINSNDNTLSVIDSWVGMDANDISSKLLYPNTTSKKRVKMSDEDVKNLSPKETRFFYKKKENKKEKTKILLQVAWVVIEDFKVESVWNIWECVFEFPSFSPLEDSRNEIKVWRETTISLVSALKKIASIWSDSSEKLALLEVISNIYNHLKDRPSNIVDEEFTLESNMKKTFNEIKSDIEKTWVVVLPWEEKIVNTFWIRDDIFYIASDFVDFNVESMPGIQEITWSILDVEKYDYTNTYRFFEIPFSPSAEHDYMIFKWCIYINSLVLKNKSPDDLDTTIKALNVSINLNTWYELENEKAFYGRLPTSQEWKIKKESVGKKKKKSNLLSIKDMEVSIKDIDTNSEDWKKQREEIIKSQSKHITAWYNEFINKYKWKIEWKKVYVSSLFTVDTKLTLEKGIEIDDIKLALKFGYLVWGDKYGNLLSKWSIKNKQEIIEFVWEITDFLNKKNASVTLPTIEFIRKMTNKIGIDNIDIILRYTKTLLKIVDKHPKYILEIMERFSLYRKSNESYDFKKALENINELLDKTDIDFTKMFEKSLNDTDEYKSYSKKALNDLKEKEYEYIEKHEYTYEVDTLYSTKNYHDQWLDMPTSIKRENFTIFSDIIKARENKEGQSNNHPFFDPKNEGIVWDFLNFIQDDPEEYAGEFYARHWKRLYTNKIWTFHFTEFYNFFKERTNIIDAVVSLIKENNSIELYRVMSKNWFQLILR